MFSDSLAAPTPVKVEINFNTLPGNARERILTLLDDEYFLRLREVRPFLIFLNLTSDDEMMIVDFKIGQNKGRWFYSQLSKD